jgi:hypothetical protein
MTEKQKQLLAALILDRNKTKAALDFVERQKQQDEIIYWETGITSEISRINDGQLRQHADGLFMQHEQTVRAYYEAMDPQ